MGDALAVSLMNQRNFKDYNFAEFHPGGSLGKMLLTKVEHRMKTKDLPTVNIDTKIEDIFTVISRGKIGLCVVVDEYFNVLGVITDGDVRRKMITKRSIF